MTLKALASTAVENRKRAVGTAENIINKDNKIVTYDREIEKPDRLLTG